MKSSNYDNYIDGERAFSISEDNPTAFLGDGSGSIISELVFTRTPDSQTRFELDISGQLGDITANTDASLYIRRASIFHDERFRLGQGLGSLSLNSSLNIVPLNDGIIPVIFSTTATYQNSDKTREVSLGYVGSLNPNETPYLISGARPTVSTGVTQSFFNNRFSLGFNLAFSPTLTMTGEREISVLAPGNSDLQDAFIYVPGEAPQRATQQPFILVGDTEPQEIETTTERYKIKIPYQIYGGIFLRGHF